MGKNVGVGLAEFSRDFEQNLHVFIQKISRTDRMSVIVQALYKFRQTYKSSDRSSSDKQMRFLQIFFYNFIEVAHVI